MSQKITQTTISWVLMCLGCTLIGLGTTRFIPFSVFGGTEPTQRIDEVVHRKQDHGMHHLRHKSNNMILPYEEIWPDSHLPSWAKKDINIPTLSANDKEGCFVHVGKGEYKLLCLWNVGHSLLTLHLSLHQLVVAQLVAFWAFHYIAMIRSL